MILMLSVAAMLAGLFLGFKDLFPLMAAQRSGVIVRRGARDIRVHRDNDPDAFARLLANRGKGASVGFGLFMAGLIGLGLSVLAFAGAGGPLAFVTLIIYLGLGVFAAFCLIRGFATDRMFAFWSMTLFGEATRKQNPTWFWAYAILNVLTILLALSTLLNALKY